jgi:hypothetical protein
VNNPKRKVPTWLNITFVLVFLDRFAIDLLQSPFEGNIFHPEPSTQNRSVSVIMPHIPVTMHAVHVFGMGIRPHPGHDLAVTPDAILVRDLCIEIVYLDWFFKISGRERRTVIPSIDRLRGVFARRIVRRVAIVTGCDPVMRRPVPPVELLAHDMTIRARFRIIQKIGVAFCIEEGVPAQTKKDAQSCRNQYYQDFSEIRSTHHARTLFNQMEHPP